MFNYISPNDKLIETLYQVDRLKPKTRCMNFEKSVKFVA